MPRRTRTPRDVSSPASGSVSAGAPDGLGNLPGAVPANDAPATHDSSSGHRLPGSSLPCSPDAGAGGAAGPAPWKVLSKDRGSRPEHDVVVVGARCAGAATAMLLARAGLRVLVLDRGRYGGDTLSTHALMRAGVLQLSRWNLLERLVAAGTPPTRNTVFHYGDEAVEIEIKPRDGVDALYAPRRTVLDALLVDAAREAGAEVRHGTKVHDLIIDAAGRVRGVVAQGPGGSAEPISAGIVIGADGMRSGVARRVGAQVEHAARHSTGVVYGYRSGLGMTGNHWYYRPGVSAGAIPTNDGNACVFASVPSSRFATDMRGDLDAGYQRVLSDCDPQLAAAVRDSAQVGKLFAFPGAPGHLRRSYGPGWALVGDAGYFKDPITAHGMTDALRDAELLTRAVLQGTTAALRGYQAERDELALGFLRLTDDVAAFDWSLESLQQTHLKLSRSMNAEVEAVLQLGSATRIAVRRSA